MNKPNYMEDIILRALATHRTKEYILAHPEYKLNLWQKLRLRYFNYLRKKGWPLAYIAGHKEFFGLDFLVNRHTLIPRPETELLVEEAVSEISNFQFPISNQFSNSNFQNIVIIDVGTGTGCIPISIAKKLVHNQSTSKPINQLTIYATDISRSTLRIAQKNAQRHGVRINFFHGDLLQPFLKQNTNSTTQQFNNSTLIITANLPYLTQRQFESEPSIQKEPKNALVADNQDGLSLYRELLEQIKLLKYSSFSIFLETDPSQTSGIKKIIQDLLPKAIVEIKNDLALRDRLVIIHIN